MLESGLRDKKGAGSFPSPKACIIFSEPEKVGQRIERIYEKKAEICTIEKKETLRRGS